MEDMKSRLGSILTFWLTMWFQIYAKIMSLNKSQVPRQMDTKYTHGLLNSRGQIPRPPYHGRSTEKYFEEYPSRFESTPPKRLWDASRHTNLPPFQAHKRNTLIKKMPRLEPYTGIEINENDELEELPIKNVINNSIQDEEITNEKPFKPSVFQKESMFPPFPSKNTHKWRHLQNYGKAKPVPPRARENVSGYGHNRPVLLSSFPDFQNTWKSESAQPSRNADTTFTVDTRGGSLISAIRQHFENVQERYKYDEAEDVEGIPLAVTDNIEDISSAEYDDVKDISSVVTEHIKGTHSRVTKDAEGSPSNVPKDIDDPPSTVAEDIMATDPPSVVAEDINVPDPPSTVAENIKATDPLSTVAEDIKATDPPSTVAENIKATTSSPIEDITDILSIVTEDIKPTLSVVTEDIKDTRSSITESIENTPSTVTEDSEDTLAVLTQSSTTTTEREPEPHHNITKDFDNFTSLDTERSSSTYTAIEGKEFQTYSTASTEATTNRAAAESTTDKTFFPADQRLAVKFETEFNITVTGISKFRTPTTELPVTLHLELSTTPIQLEVALNSNSPASISVIEVPTEITTIPTIEATKASSVFVMKEILNTDPISENEMKFIQDSKQTITTTDEVVISSTVNPREALENFNLNISTQSHFQTSKEIPKIELNTEQIRSQGVKLADITESSIVEDTTVHPMNSSRTMGSKLQINFKKSSDDVIPAQESGIVLPDSPISSTNRSNATTSTLSVSDHRRSSRNIEQNLSSMQILEWAALSHPETTNAALSPLETTNTALSHVETANSSLSYFEATNITPHRFETVNSAPNDLETLTATPDGLETLPATPNDLETLTATPGGLETLPATPNDLETLTATPEDLETLPATSNDLETLTATPNDLEMGIIQEVQSESYLLPNTSTSSRNFDGFLLRSQEIEIENPILDHCILIMKSCKGENFKLLCFLDCVTKLEDQNSTEADTPNQMGTVKLNSLIQIMEEIIYSLCKPLQLLSFPSNINHQSHQKLKKQEPKWVESLGGMVKINNLKHMSKLANSLPNLFFQNGIGLYSGLDPVLRALNDTMTNISDTTFVPVHKNSGFRKNIDARGTGCRIPADNLVKIALKLVEAFSQNETLLDALLPGYVMLSSLSSMPSTTTTPYISAFEAVKYGIDSVTESGRGCSLIKFGRTGDTINCKLALPTVQFRKSSSYCKNQIKYKYVYMYRNGTLAPNQNNYVALRHTVNV